MKKMLMKSPEKISAEEWKQNFKRSENVEETNANWAEIWECAFVLFVKWKI